MLNYIMLDEADISISKGYTFAGAIRGDACIDRNQKRTDVFCQMTALFNKNHNKKQKGR